MSDKSTKGGPRNIFDSLDSDGQKLGREDRSVLENVFAFNDKMVPQKSDETLSPEPETLTSQSELGGVEDTSSRTESTGLFKGDHPKQEKLADTEIAPASKSFKLNWAAFFWLLLFVASAGALIYIQYNKLDRFQNRSNLIDISSELDSNFREVGSQAQRASTGGTATFDALSRLQAQIDTKLSDIRSVSETSRSDPISISAIEELIRVEQGWNAIRPDVGTLLKNSDAVEKTIGEVTKVNQLTSQLLVKTDHIVKKLIDQQANLTLINIANRQRFLTQRIKANMNEFAAGNPGWESAATRFGQDVKLFGQISNTIAFEGDEEIVKLLIETENLYDKLFQITDSIMSNIGAYFTMRSAANNIVKGSEVLKEISSEFHQKLKNPTWGVSNLRIANMRYLFWVLGGIALFSLIALLQSIFRYSKKHGVIDPRKMQGPDSAAIKLFSEMSAITNGDLSADVHVTEEDVTGAIANSINLLTGKMRSLVSETKFVAEQIQEATGETSALKENLVSSSDTQAQKINCLAEDIANMYEAIYHISESSIQAREQVAATSEVSKSGFNNIRNKLQLANTAAGKAFQDVEQKLMRLMEASQKVDGIADLLNTLTTRVEVLSLNASINAGGTDKFGYEFATVAHEAQELVAQSGRAAESINYLANDLKQNISHTTAAMNFAKTLVSSRLNDVDVVGQCLSEIELMGQKALTMTDRTAEDVNTEAIKVLAISNRANAFRKPLPDVDSNLAKVGESLTRLQDMVARLQQSTEKFKLPQDV